MVVCNQNSICLSLKLTNSTKFYNFFRKRVDKGLSQHKTLVREVGGAMAPIWSSCKRLLSILCWRKMYIILIFSIKWKHEMISFYTQNMPKLPPLCTKIDHVIWHVNWHVNWLVTFFSFSSWPLFSVAEKERTTGVLYVVDSSCPENIGSSTVSKVSYFNSFFKLIRYLEHF